MSVRFRNSLQAAAIVLPLVAVTGQMPAAMAASAPTTHSITAPADTPAPPVVNPPVTAPAAPAAAENSVDPQSKNKDTSGNTISALNLKEDLAEICAAEPVKLPFTIFGTNDLNALLDKLKLTLVLGAACGAVDELGKTITQLTAADGPLGFLIR
jgi:3-oxoacyl-ACP reductase-like protein